MDNKYSLKQKKIMSTTDPSTCEYCSTNASFEISTGSSIFTNATSYDNSTNETASDLTSSKYREEIVSEWLWKIVPPILFVIGMTGNWLTIRVVLRLGPRNQPTLMFLLFLAITDSVVLVVGLPRYWLMYMFEYDLRTISTWSCKFLLFFIYLSMQYSSWILVGVTLERVVKTYLPFKYHRIYNARKVTIGLIATLFVLILVNGHLFFTNGINEYSEGSCGSLNEDAFYFDENVFVFIDFGLLSIVPFAIMMVCNVFLVRILRQAMQNRQTMVHESMVHRANRFSVRMTKMLVVCTFYFLFATTPVSVYFILDTYLTPGYEESGDDFAVARLDLFWTATYVFQFSNYCVNFYLYTAMNDRFYREFRAILRCQPSLRRQRIYKQRGTSTSNRSSNRTTVSTVINSSLGLEECSESEAV